MNIGLDIDSTINKAREFDLKDMRILMKKYNIPIIMEDLTKNDIRDVYGLWNMPELFKEYERSHYPWIHEFCPPDNDSVEVIQKLYKKHNIFIITARDEFRVDDGELDGLIMKRKTLKWLQKNKIPYDDIIFSAGTKYKVCEENKIDIMFDDDPINIIALSKNGIPTAIRKHTYNSHLNYMDNTFMIDNWKHFDNLISLCCKMWKGR